MNINVNWADVSFGLILLAFATLAAVTYGVVETRRIAAEDTRSRQAFDREMATVRTTAWDGETYDWPPNLAGYLDDPYAYAEPNPTAPMPAIPSRVRWAQPVPPSTVSGPLPELNTDLDADAFIASMTAQTSAFIAQLAEPVTAR